MSSCHGAGTDAGARVAQARYIVELARRRQASLHEPVALVSAHVSDVVKAASTSPNGYACIGRRPWSETQASLLTGYTTVSSERYGRGSCKRTGQQTTNTHDNVQGGTGCQRGTVHLRMAA